MNTKFKIKLCLVISFISLTLNCIATETSSDSLTVEEMKAMFYKRYINGVKPKNLDEYDILKWNIHFKDPINLCYLVNNQVLRKPKGLKLPPSAYVIYGDTLCWVKPRQSIDPKESEELVQKLQKKYGTIHINDTLTLIPAKWITGELELLSRYPEEYATTYFSSMAYKKNVCNGIISGSDISLDLGNSSLEMDIRFIVRGNNGYNYNTKSLPMIQTYDKFNVPKEKTISEDKLRYKRLFTLFGRDINRMCPPAPKDYDYANPKIYSLLLYFDAQQYVHVEVLLPKQLDEKDQFMLSNLRKAIESQPAGLFESHFTIDGKIFPGLYIKAYYGGLGWNLFDYRTLEEE